MKLRIPFIVQLFILIACKGNCQQIFPKEYLDSPIKFATWFDNNLPLRYIDRNEKSNDTLICLLLNGYAEYKIKNQDILIEKLKSNDVDRIEILFTDYPKRKEDWVTNYYELLANRIKEVIKIDTRVNSKPVEWSLIMQTGCKTGREAMHFDHGIIIHLMPRKTTIITDDSKIKDFEKKDEPIIEHPEDSYGKKDNSSKKELSNLGPIPGEDAMIPLNVLHKIPTKEYKPPKRIKNKDEPGCPKFKTRADKPKKRILRRLFM